MSFPSEAERALRWRLTDDEVGAGIEALQRLALRYPTAEEVRERAITDESYAPPVPGSPVWVTMAQEHPNRRVYRGLVVTRPTYTEGGAWGCTAWVELHANFPGRLLLLGRMDDTEWAAYIDDEELEG